MYDIEYNLSLDGKMEDQRKVTGADEGKHGKRTSKKIPCLHKRTWVEGTIIKTNIEQKQQRGRFHFIDNF